LQLGCGTELPSSPASEVYTKQTADAEAARGQLVARAEELSGAFAPVAKVLKPSVVSITATKKVNLARGGERGLPQGIPEEFRRFFGDDFGQQFETPAPAAVGAMASPLNKKFLPDLGREL
jgi:S1-C subfamily serine protease